MAATGRFLNLSRAFSSTRELIFRDLLLFEFFSMAPVRRFKLPEPVIVNGWSVVYSAPLPQDDEEPLWGAMQLLAELNVKPAAVPKAAIPDPEPVPGELYPWC